MKKESGALRLYTGLTAPEGFLEQVFSIDKLVYSEELCGVIENMHKRYWRCRDTYLLVYDGDRVVGYICFLPIGETLLTQLNDPDDRTMRDDDITPEEMEPWSLAHLNHLFILSVAILPEYRDGQAVRLLSDGLLAFLRDKEAAGYAIGSISGSAVSDGGANFIRRLHGTFVKELDEGYRYFRADRNQVKELLANGLLLKNLRK